MIHIKDFLPFIITVANNQGWVSGLHQGYKYQAKVYQEPSVHGICGGRISKLTIMQKDRIVAHYDRGWDVEPQGPDIEVFERIIDIFDKG